MCPTTTQCTTSCQTVAGNSNNTAGSSISALNLPQKIYIDSLSNLYVSDSTNQRVIKFSYGSTTNGQIILGTTGVPGSNLSLLDYPTGLQLDSNGNLLVVDANNHRVIKLFTNGTVTVVAGISGQSSSSLNHLRNPNDLYITADNTLYVSDQNNNRVLRFAPNSTGGDNGIIVASGLNDPRAVYVDTNLNLYVADTNSHVIRQFTRTNATYNVLVAGNTTAGSSTSLLNLPRAVTLDETTTPDTMYIADTGNNRILTWVIGATSGTVFAGTSSPGPCTSLNNPFDVKLDLTKSKVYIADYNNNRVMRSN
ncbi:unnamed protein product, partial [Didymodactylos carnosus]